MKTSLALCVCAALAVASGAAAGDNGPVFLQWLMPESPSDQVIRDYWKMAEAEEATAEELLDLGTMLFFRGYPKDAVRLYKRALKLDPKMSEAWFRIGLVKHREGETRDAENAYHKCLDILTGHGWCNFYMGLLQERAGRPSKALHYYRRAFKFAPELSNPRVNPEVLYSELHLAALLRIRDRDRFTGYFPMPFLEPGKVEAARAQYEPEPVPQETPLPDPTAEGDVPVSANPPAVVIDGTTTEGGGKPTQSRQGATAGQAGQNKKGQPNARQNRRSRRPAARPTPSPQSEIHSE
ncbi:MAG: tetratricopeptide repeat protein [bacterium]|nr:tetratricopeptide repeat protein [bacterium]